MKPPNKLNDDIIEAAKHINEYLGRATVSQEERFRGIPNHNEIKDLLDRGLDAYHITQRLGCRYVDVLNVVRTYHGMKPLTEEPIIYPDTQSQGQERLTLFPGVP